MTIRRSIIGKINPLLPEEEQRKMSTAEKILQAHEQMALLGIITEETYNLIKREFDINLCEIADWWDNLRIMPRWIHADNGADLRSKDFKNLAKKYHINLSYRPVGGAQYGGLVERVLGTLNRGAFNIIPGSTKGNTIERGDYDSENRAVLLFNHIEAIFLLEILRYHVRIHSKLKIPPYEAWKRAVERGDNLSLFNITDERGRRELKELAYHTIPTVSRTFGIAGISIDNIKYNYDKSFSNTNDKSWNEHYERGAKITVRRDSQDIRFIWWWNPNIDNEGKPVRVWANEISLGGGRTYSRDQLKRLSLPISILQYHDLQSLNYLQMGLEQADQYERLSNSLDSITFAIQRTIPRNKKERQKVFRKVAGMVEQSFIASQELQETAGYITGESPAIKAPSEIKKLPSATNGKIIAEEELESGLLDEDEIKSYPTDMRFVLKKMKFGSWQVKEDEDK